MVGQTTLVESRHMRESANTGRIRLSPRNQYLSKYTDDDVKSFEYIDKSRRVSSQINTIDVVFGVCIMQTKFISHLQG